MLAACSNYQVRTTEATIQTPFISPIASAPKIKQQLITLKESRTKLGSVLLKNDSILNQKQIDDKASGTPSHKSWLPQFAHYIKRGIASWYGPGFHGKKTANGEIFNMYKLTAAHRTLPIPSYVQVTNLRNHKTVVVRINDRGPYAHHRVLDLSFAAAKAIGLKGTGRVEIKTVEPTSLAAQTDSKEKS